MVIVVASCLISQISVAVIVLIFMDTLFVLLHRLHVHVLVVHIRC